MMIRCRMFLFKRWKVRTVMSVEKLTLISLQESPSIKSIGMTTSIHVDGRSSVVKKWKIRSKVRRRKHVLSSRSSEYICYRRDSAPQNLLKIVSSSPLPADTGTPHCLPLSLYPPIVIGYLHIQSIPQLVTSTHNHHHGSFQYCSWLPPYRHILASFHDFDQLWTSIFCFESGFKKRFCCFVLVLSLRGG